MKLQAEISVIDTGDPAPVAFIWTFWWQGTQGSGYASTLEEGFEAAVRACRQNS